LKIILQVTDIVIRDTACLVLSGMLCFYVKNGVNLIILIKIDVFYYYIYLILKKDKLV